MGLFFEGEVLPREGWVDDVPVKGQDFVMGDRAGICDVVDSRCRVDSEKDKEREEVRENGGGVLGGF